MASLSLPSTTTLWASPKQQEYIYKKKLRGSASLYYKVLLMLFLLWKSNAKCHCDWHTKKSGNSINQRTIQQF